MGSIREMEERSILDWAKEYHSKGYSCIPIQEGGKKPSIKWQKYQKERATLDELTLWFQGGHSNIGIVTGFPHSFVVLDFDYRHMGGVAERSIQGLSGVRCITGGGGTHWYCNSGGVAISNHAGLLEGFDVRGHGGYVVAPPSKTEGYYKFDYTGYGREGQGQVQSIPEPERLPLLVDSVLKLILFKKKPDEFTHGSSNSKAGSLMQVQFLPAREGERNSTAARVAGSIARNCCDYTRGLTALRLWNRVECVPSLSDDELESVWRSIWAKANRNSDVT